MNLGYDKPLYLLPFDHRQSYAADMFHFKPLLTVRQREQIIDSKQLIYEGFRQALTEGVPVEAAGWLTIAAGVPGFIGFAVGRTSFWDAVSGYRAQSLTRAEAATQIAGRLREWVDVFEGGRQVRVA